MNIQRSNRRRHQPLDGLRSIEENIEAYEDDAAKKAALTLMVDGLAHTELRDQGYFVAAGLKWTLILRAPEYTETVLVLADDVDMDSDELAQDAPFWRLSAGVEAFRPSEVAKHPEEDGVAHQYAVVDPSGRVVSAWTDARDAGHDAVRAEGERLTARCGFPAVWVYVEEPCEVGDDLDIDDDGCATVVGGAS